MVQWVKNLTVVAWVTVEVERFNPQPGAGSGIAAAAAWVAAVAWIQFLAQELPYVIFRYSYKIRIKKKEMF